MKIKDFEDKVVSLSNRIYPMVDRMLGDKDNAKDAIQEIMIKLWERRKKIANHPNINGYVFLTARNYCLDLLKKKSPDFKSYESPMVILESGIENNQVEWQELTQIIEEIIKELPTQQAEILMMRDIDGFEFVEIATATKLKVEYVRVLLSRARKQVGMKLKNEYSYE